MAKRKLVVHFRCATCDDDTQMSLVMPDYGQKSDDDEQEEGLHSTPVWHVRTQDAQCERCIHIRKVIARMADELTQRWAHSLAEYRKLPIPLPALDEVNAVREEHKLPLLTWADV